MNIPSQIGQGPAAYADYLSLYAAPSSKSSFEQTFAETLASSLSLTTAEGDLITLSGLSQSLQQTQGTSWLSPASTGINLTSSAMTAEAMGLSVQGDLNDQELADITKMVGELTSIAATFFSGDHEGAMTRAMDFGTLGLGSISSFAASFSRQTVIQTRLTSYTSLPDMADINTQDLSRNPKTEQSEALDYAQLLEARWQQILKALDEIKEHNLDGILARRTPLQPGPKISTPAASGQQPEAVRAQTRPASLPPQDETAQQMLARMQELLADHPQLTPFANSLASTAMEKAATQTEQDHPTTARALSALQNAFRNQLHQWLFSPVVPAATQPLTAV